MNRADRRKMAKKMKGKNTFFNPGSEKIDHTKNEWCWRHPIQLDDIDHPTEKDKEKLAEITLIVTKTELKDGTIKRGKMCPKCFVFVALPDTNEGAKVEGFTIR